MPKPPESKPPPIVDPRQLEEKGVTIPVPTPTATSVPNPWKPPANQASPEGNGGRPEADPGAASSEQPPDSQSSDVDDDA